MNAISGIYDTQAQLVLDNVFASINNCHLKTVFCVYSGCLCFMLDFVFISETIYYKIHPKTKQIKVGTNNVSQLCTFYSNCTLFHFSFTIKKKP